jgi:hypothetical protein
MPRWRNGRRVGLRYQCREACQFDSGSRHKLWPCGETADTLRLERSVFGRAGATPARATNFSVWVEAEVVQAGHCECSVSGCESRRSNRISRRGGEARQAVATRLTHVQIVSACPDFRVWRSGSVRRLERRGLCSIQSTLTNLVGP